jgi:hypothetical protein
MNDIGKLRRTTVAQNDLIGATGYYDVLTAPHQPTNELLGPVVL